MATTLQVVDQFAQAVWLGKINVSSDTFKAALTNTAMTKAGTAVLADITPIAGTGGYAALTLTGVVFAETGAGTGIWEMDFDPLSWTPSGAAFATAQNIAIYDDTATNKDIVGYLALGSFTLADGATLLATPGANGAVRTTVS